MSEVDTANLLTILGCADIFTRLLQGLLGDCNAVKKRFRRPHKALYTLMASLAGTSLIGEALDKKIYIDRVYPSLSEYYLRESEHKYFLR